MTEILTRGPQDELRKPDAVAAKSGGAELSRRNHPRS
jgi:hypothetical protein